MVTLHPGGRAATKAAADVKIVWHIIVLVCGTHLYFLTTLVYEEEQSYGYFEL